MEWGGLRLLEAVGRREGVGVKRGVNRWRWMVVLGGLGGVSIGVNGVGLGMFGVRARDLGPVVCSGVGGV